MHNDDAVEGGARTDGVMMGAAGSRYRAYTNPRSRLLGLGLRSFNSSEMTRDIIIIIAARLAKIPCLQHTPSIQLSPDPSIAASRSIAGKSLGFRESCISLLELDDLDP